MMEDQVKKLYDMQRWGRLKCVVSAVICYLFLLVFVSLLYGNPFPHKDKVLFIEVEQKGWVTTNPELLVLCGILSLFVALGFSMYKIVKSFKRIDLLILL